MQSGDGLADVPRDVARFDVRLAWAVALVEDRLACP